MHVRVQFVFHIILILFLYHFLTFHFILLFFSFFRLYRKSKNNERQRNTKNKVRIMNNSKSKLILFPRPSLFLLKYNEKNSTSDSVDFEKKKRELLDGNFSSDYRGIFGPLSAYNEPHCKSLPYYQVRYYYCVSLLLLLLRSFSMLSC